MTNSKATVSNNQKVRRIFVTAGETSGDNLGASLIRSIKQQAPFPVEFYGVGGKQMEEQGVRSLFPMKELSVMGIIEVIPNIMGILKRIQQTADAYNENNYDMMVTIDSPDFSFRVAKQVLEERKAASKMVHYVAPTVWAWRESRAAKVASLYNSILCLYPCEPEYFEKQGMHAHFIGHPVMDDEQYKRSADENRDFREELGISKKARVLGVLFGSRRGEINRMGEDFIRGVRRFVANNSPGVHIVALTLPHLKIEVSGMLQQAGCKFNVIDDHRYKWDALNIMDCALAVSGTAGLELAVANVPHIIGYKMNPITAQIVKYAVKVKHAHLANILLEDNVVPELIQGACEPDNIAEQLDILWNDEDAALTQQQSFAKLRAIIKPSKEKQPSEMAALHLISMLS